MDIDSGGNYMPYFLTCDGHWSARGNRVAANVLEPWLGEKGGPESSDSMPAK
jgi:hypothetical protein